MIAWLFTRFRLRNAREQAKVRVRCSCHRDRPSARDLTGHRPGCVNHPPPGWPHDHQRPVGRVRVVEDEHGIRPVPWAEQRPAESRALVRDPNDRLWLLDEAGRVNRRVEPEELESWASWAEPSDIRAAEGEPTVVLPARYVGIPFSISRVDWAEFVRRGGPPPGPPNPPRPPHDRPYA